MKDTELLTIGDQSFRRGEKGVVEIPIGSLIDYQPVTMTVHVRRGRKPGPVLLLTAGIHGDEIIGVEILRRLLKSKKLGGLNGTLLIVPVVCMPAFLARSRYLPDRRDLNRLFPGASQGSLGARLASAFVSSVITHADYAIDFHTGAQSRPNLPQIRFDPSNAEALEMAKAYAPPVILESALRDGSLRAVYSKKKIPSIIYEAGEAFRLDPLSVRYGLRGIYGVMRHLKMLATPKSGKPPSGRTILSRNTFWVRAPQGGIFTPHVDLGSAISPDKAIGIVGDPFGRRETEIICDAEGVVIGMNREATADEGDALFHIATTSNPEKVEAHIIRNDEILEEHTDALQ